VWGKADVTDAMLGQAVLKARRALDDDGRRQRFIRTVPRFGYEWIAPARRCNEPELLTGARSDPEARSRTPNLLGPAGLGFAAAAAVMIWAALTTA
jgi:DNA-binding winged helix-turn-helix (wHTH) protein